MHLNAFRNHGVLYLGRAVLPRGQHWRRRRFQDSLSLASRRAQTRERPKVSNVEL